MTKTEVINLLWEIKAELIKEIIESDNVSLDKIKAINYAIACITNSRERDKDE